MTVQLLLSFAAWAFLTAAALILVKKRRFDAMLVGFGAACMATSALTMTFANAEYSAAVGWPIWFWLVGNLGPVGILLVSVAVMRLAFRSR